MFGLRDFVMVLEQARAMTPALQPAGRPALQLRRSYADTQALTFSGGDYGTTKVVPFQNSSTVKNVLKLHS
ncbi:MAG: hypothetical protein ABSA42_08535 [Terracidiphilus sp.]|jgi:hypothetical protein